MEVQITHPFHPLKGQRIVLATRRANWGEDRVMFFDAQGRLRSLPAAWTDVDPPDAWAEAATGRAALRLSALAALVVLISEIKSQRSKRASKC